MRLAALDRRQKDIRLGSKEEGGRKMVICGEMIVELGAVCSML